jgi:zinc transport system substrate-binding protein
MKYFLFFILSFLFSFPLLPQEGKKPIVAVSITPYSGFLSTLLEDIALIHVCVPGSMSAHTWEPKPNDILPIKESVLWFGIGEPFEQKLLLLLQEEKYQTHFVDLRKGIEVIHGHSCCHHETHGIDPHIWLSPLKLIQQIGIIEDALKEAFPSQASLIEERATQIKNEVQTLHNSIIVTLKPYEGTVLVVAHSAYTYFCEEYNLIQLPIEQEGKEPNIHQLVQLMDKAKEAHVHTIFTQKQYPKKAAEQIGKALKAQIQELNPYDKEYIPMMQTLTNAFEREGKLQKE